MEHDENDSVEGHVARGLFRTDSDDTSSRSLNEDDVEAAATSSMTSICPHMHVQLEQKSVGGSIAEQLWPAATCLANFVLQAATGAVTMDCSNNQERDLLTCLQQQLSEPGVPFVELGAGVGLTGLELATQLSCRVLLTDLPVGLVLLRRNTDLNRDRFLLADDAVAVQKLEWGDESDAQEALEWCQKTAKNCPIVILGSDCVYWVELQEPLERTIFSLLSRAPPGSICLLAGVRRWKRDNAFYQSLGRRTRTKTHELQCTCVREIVTRSSGEREIMRVYAVQYVARNRNLAKS